MKKRYYTIAFLCTAALLTSCGSEKETIETEIMDPSALVTEASEYETTEITSVSQTVKISETSETSKISAPVSGTSSETTAKPSETSAEKKNGSSSSQNNSSNNQKNEEVNNPASYSGEATAPPVHDDHGPSAPSEQEPEEDDPIPESSDVIISLNDGSAECSSDKVSVNGSEVTLKAEGIYKLYGSLNGQIIVDAPKDAKVQLELNGVNISCGYGPAIRIESSDKVKIVSAGGSDNCLSDGGSSEACIFSKDDLTLKGDGKITVNGNVKNAVYSKNTLKITGGTFEINSANNGLVGKDKVVVENGNITINSAKDGIKATNDTESGRGTASVIGGTLCINAGDDAIQAISGVTVTNCSITVKAEGKKVNCDAGSSVDEGCITKIK